MTITPIHRLHSAVSALRGTISGVVILPGDADYALVRLAWNLDKDQPPALILFPFSAQDVAEGIHFARRQRLAVVVHSTKQGVLPPNDCLLIIPSYLAASSLNAVDPTAWTGISVFDCNLPAHHETTPAVLQLLNYDEGNPT